MNKKLKDIKIYENVILHIIMTLCRFLFNYYLIKAIIAILTRPFR